MKRKVVIGDYTDDSTGIRFLEDDRGNYHVMQKDTENRDVNVVVDLRNSFEMENKRLKKILESLRRENVWLWEQIEIARQTAQKKTPKKAIDDLVKAIKERQRA